MTAEASLERADDGVVPVGDGWFVLNARDSRWFELAGLGACASFEGQEEFAELGIQLNLLPPGEANCLYHSEPNQEDFLVLRGECLLVVEDQERRLRAWDFVHCPPGTAHVFVGAGTEPCLLLAVGRRRPGVGARYPADSVAAAHGAAVEADTSSARDAYSRFGRPHTRPYREGDLPG